MPERAAVAAATPLGPDSATWRLHREIVLLAGWGRAILLQLAHPLVAQGVADHSAFARDPGSGMSRLGATLATMLALTFGSAEEAAAAATRINRIHDRVHGFVPPGAGHPAAGTRYSAHDPALLTWVHVTLLDSFLLSYELFVAPLRPDERDRYCAESARIEPLLGIPGGRLPRTYAAMRASFSDVLTGGDIAVTDAARGLAREIVRPRVPLAARPLVPLARLPTIGLLPVPIRDAYGLRWTAGRARALRLIAWTSRHGLPWLPPPLRYWPAARAAMRRHGRAGRSSGDVPASRVPPSRRSDPR